LTKIIDLEKSHLKEVIQAIKLCQFQILDHLSKTPSSVRSY